MLLFAIAAVLAISPAVMQLRANDTEVCLAMKYQNAYTKKASLGRSSAGRRRQNLTGVDEGCNVTVVSAFPSIRTEYFMERRESAEISALLYIGFLADRVLLALDAHGPDRLAAEEPGLVSDLVAFLAEVRELAEQPTALLSRESAAFAFPPAKQIGLRLISLEVDKSQRGAIKEYVGKLEQAALSLKNGNVPSQAALSRLRAFLETIAERSLEQVDDRQVREEAGTSERRSLIEWKKT